MPALFSGRKRFILVALIFLFTFLTYFGISDNGLHCDDYWLVRNNSISQITATFHEGWGFRPVVWLEFLFLYELFGDNPFWYYMVNLATISCLVVLIVFLAEFFLKNEILAVLSGLFFLMHTNNTEMFFWISGNIGTTGILLTLSSFYLFLLNRRKWSLFVFAVSLATYELGIFIPFMIALYVLLTEFRAKAAPLLTKILNIVRSLKVTIPYFIAALVYIGFIKFFFGMNFFGLANSMQKYSLSVYQTQFMRYFYYLLQGLLVKDFMLSALLFLVLIGLVLFFILKKKEERRPLLFYSLCVLFFFMPFLAREGYSYRHGSFGLTMFAPLVVLVAYLAISGIMNFLSKFFRSFSGRKRAAEFCLIGIVAILLTGNLHMNSRIETEWELAGQQNEAMLDLFIDAYPDPPEGKIIFTNIPAYRERALAFITFFDLALSDRYKHMAKEKPPEEIIFYPDTPPLEELKREHPDTAMVFLWKGDQYQVIVDSGGSRADHPPQIDPNKKL